MLPVFDVTLILFSLSWFAWILLPCPTKLTVVDLVVSIAAAGSLYYFIIRNHDLFDRCIMINFFALLGILAGVVGCVISWLAIKTDAYLKNYDCTDERALILIIGIHEAYKKILWVSGGVALIAVAGVFIF